MEEALLTPLIHAKWLHTSPLIYKEPTLPINEIAITQIKWVQYLATAIFFIAIVHTFIAHKFAKLRHKFEPDSAAHNFFHFLGEVEIVFGLWSAIFLAICGISLGINSSVEYIDSLNYAEPAFVFCIMCMASTKPILYAAQYVISKLATLISSLSRINFKLCEFFTILFLGPLLGSLITEPAAMTVTALLIKQFLVTKDASKTFKYSVLGLLFVSVSIGGSLTNFAAPPVLMVAHKFGWNNSFMFFQFGLKAIICIFISTLLCTFYFRNFIKTIKEFHHDSKSKMPHYIILTHIFFMLLTVIYHKHIQFFMGIFLLFMGFTEITKVKQSSLKLRDSLLVGFFLAGLMTLGNLQSWWIEKLFQVLSHQPLYFGVVALTAATDNAALTYLGGLVPNLSPISQYYLVAGALVGGGLTVIANAPNPAGAGILKDSFGPDGINPKNLFLGAILPTLLAILVFWIY